MILLRLTTTGIEIFILGRSHSSLHRSSTIEVFCTDLLVVATDLLDLAGEGLYPALGDAVLVERHLELPLNLIVVGLDLGELEK